MKTYRIPVSWTVTATMEIEAESLEEAVLIADGRTVNCSALRFLADSKTKRKSPSSSQPWTN